MLVREGLHTGVVVKALRKVTPLVANSSKFGVYALGLPEAPKAHCA